MAIIDSDVLIEMMDSGIAERLSFLFSIVYVPMSVKKEQIKHRRRHKLNRLLATGLFERCSADNKDSVQFLVHEKLGSGEAEAIVQAQEKNIPVILTNDRDASKMATRFNLRAIRFRELQ